MIKMRDLLKEEKFNEVDLKPKHKYILTALDFPNLPPRIVRFVGIYGQSYKFTDLENMKSFNLYSKHFKDYKLELIN